MKKICILCFILISACSTKSVTTKKKTYRPVVSSTTTPENKDIKPIQGKQFTTIIFEPGSSILSDTSKNDLLMLTKKLKQERKSIRAIKILSWADKEYPNKIERVSVLDVMLANDRSKKIQKVVEQGIKSIDADVVTYNMAKRPDTWSKIVQDDDYDLKKTFEVSGTTSTRLNNGSLSYTKASKAIVIIDYK